MCAECASGFGAGATCPAVSMCTGPCESLPLCSIHVGSHRSLGHSLGPVGDGDPATHRVAQSISEVRSLGGSWQPAVVSGVIPPTLLWGRPG